MTTWGAGMWWTQQHRAWCGLIASLPDGRLLVRYELTWLRKSPETAAGDIVAFTKARKITLRTVVAQPAIFPKKTGAIGETISETFKRFGVPMVAGDDDRINGWSRMTSWFESREHGGKTVPSLLIHPDCVRLLKILPHVQASETKPDDVEETTDVFPASGLRLYLMSRPHPWEKPKPPVPGPNTWGAVLRKLQRKPTDRRIVGADLVR